MSRLEFRAAVEAPRPTSAWIMVAVGGATLWMTRQLEPWAVAAQVVAILVSLYFRTQPHPWQRSPIALNVGMFAVAACTIWVALRGQPSTIALAHFAALAQGLQLLDARPRRTEFLLVALALFQVVLAANLTDSILFVPLLAAFVVSTTWTLMVHTLRTEALEAGTPGALNRTITPGLLKSTLLASAASLLLALAIFMVLPRMRSSVVTGGLGASLATAGFSDQIELGDLGRIRQDGTVVMRVKTIEGTAPPPERAYWRGLAFDTFDGRSWSITPSRKHPVRGNTKGGIALGSGEGSADLVQEIVREPVSSGVIFGLGTPERLEGDLRRIERDVNGGLYALMQARERVRYTIETQTTPSKAPDLDADAAKPPAGEGERYLRLPEFREPVGELARRVTSASTTDAERARALESHLLRSGRYDDTPPRLDSNDERSPVEIFLFGDTSGHCEYFATAMVVMARSLGIPARLVNGFAGGRENRIGGFVELARSDAHAWVEIHFEEAGWVRYDPTPPDLRLRTAGAAWMLERVRELGSAIELWWFQRVVEFDRTDQFRLFRTGWLAWRGAKSATTGEDAPLRSLATDWRFDRGIAVRVLGLALGFLLVLTTLRRMRGRGSGALPPDYARALRLLARRGLQRAPASTARDFARSVRAAVPVEAACAFERLTDSYLEERFGGCPARPARSELARLRAGLRRKQAPA